MPKVQAERAIEVEGLREFRLALAAMGKEWPRELARTHRLLASEVALSARGYAAQAGPVQRHFANKIQGRGFPDMASIYVRSKANAAIWGSKKHTGWYGPVSKWKKPPTNRWANGPNDRFRDSPEGNNPKWVGASWVPGGPGGPYCINDAIRNGDEKIQDRYLELINVLARTAFPN